MQKKKRFGISRRHFGPYVSENTPPPSISAPHKSAMMPDVPPSNAKLVVIARGAKVSSIPEAKPQDLVCTVMPVRSLVERSSSSQFDPVFLFFFLFLSFKHVQWFCVVAQSPAALVWTPPSLPRAWLMASADMGSPPPAVSTSAPISLIRTSCSIAITCCSSAQHSANGTPIKSAETEMDHMERPAKKTTPLTTRCVVSHLFQNQERVVGGTISRRAEIRSERLSWVGS